MIHIFLETTDILAVDKPRGLASIPEQGVRECLLSLLSAQFPEKLYVVHRLDKEVSGVIDKPLREFGSGRMGVDAERGKPSPIEFRITERLRKGQMSKVTFSLTPTKGNTRLAFTHTGVPDEHYEAIRQGWIDHYWTPMKALLEHG